MTLPLTPPLKPMLAKLARTIPDGDGWLYEPKWDGFRCIVFRDGDQVVLGSRGGKELTRYFPEVVDAVRAQLREYGIRDRVPRPIIPGEKRALNKRVVEALADELYALELEAAPEAQQWALRKAAWAIEELGQDIGLVYRTMGVKGLAAIPDVGSALAGKIETYLKADKAKI